ncbi:dTMP kinase [Halobacteriales archaeon SW_5_68_122]|nr:MAG: dTMP kinase [Halobacteriales archaeon SW_5_68_122]
MLITLEGIDGSGKTTVAEALQDTLPEAVFTREPTDSWYGEAVQRSIGDDGADPLAELFLYTADHADHLSRVVRPALESGKVVVSDRYSDSRYAYQGATLDGVVRRPVEYVRGVHEPFTRAPDATLYFDVPPETGAERAGARFVRIDATRPPEAVVAAAEDAVERLL